ncbi:hypothetical protein RDI58_027555 [Solanum bulbocastanum]|uniref:MBD domain-containing protein n=1 Tax=Solanum bulbocastanum TaxID=147425 RepID=A0AAN8SZ25_SOLBU
MEMENKDVAVEKTNAVPIELPAPPGWKKRFTPGKSSTPRRNDIVFVSPDSDEIKNKRQLDKYLKSHPGGPPASEFNWGTGDTPRRSTRVGGKSKATETPESDAPSTKRQRKSSSKKEAKVDGGEREAEGATEKETKASDEPALPDAEDLEVQDLEMASKNLTDGDNIKDEKEKTNDGEIVPKEPLASEDKMEIVHEKEETKDEEEKINDGEIVPKEPLASEDKMEIVQEKEETKDEEEKTNDGEIVPEEPPESEDKMEIVQEKEETLDEGNIEKMKNREVEDKPLDNSLKTDNKTLPLNVFEENKIESKPAGADASSHSAELSKATSVSQEEAPAAADPLVQNSNDGKVHENEQIDREIPIEEIIGTESAAADVNSSVQQ